MTIEIVLAELPPMLRDIVVEALSEQPDLSIVGEIEGAEELSAVSERRPDLVILGLEDAELPDAYRELLAADPNMRIVTVSGEGRRAFLHELRHDTTSLGELSRDTLLDAIRRVDQDR